MFYKFLNNKKTQNNTTDSFLNKVFICVIKRTPKKRTKKLKTKTESFRNRFFKGKFLFESVLLSKTKPITFYNPNFSLSSLRSEIQFLHRKTEKSSFKLFLLEACKTTIDTSFFLLNKRKQLWCYKLKTKREIPKRHFFFKKSVSLPETTILFQKTFLNISFILFLSFPLRTVYQCYSNIASLCVKKKVAFLYSPTATNCKPISKRKGSFLYFQRLFFLRENRTKRKSFLKTQLVVPCGSLVSLTTRKVDYRKVLIAFSALVLKEAAFFCLPSSPHVVQIMSSQREVFCLAALDEIIANTESQTIDRFSAQKQRTAKARRLFVSLLVYLRKVLIVFGLLFFRLVFEFFCRHVPRTDQLTELIEVLVDCDWQKDCSVSKLVNNDDSFSGFLQVIRNTNFVIHFNKQEEAIVAAPHSVLVDSLSSGFLEDVTKRALDQSIRHPVVEIVFAVPLRELVAELRARLDFALAFGLGFSSVVVYRLTNKVYSSRNGIVARNAFLQKTNCFSPTDLELIINRFGLDVFVKSVHQGKFGPLVQSGLRAESLRWFKYLLSHEFGLG